MIIIAVDVGTTNSRIRVVEDNNIIVQRKNTLGIKDVAMTGDKNIILTELKILTEEALKECNKSISQVEYFVASGMITSNLGLCEIPHRISPIGIEDLSKAVVKKTFEELNNIPFYFIPGVKNNTSEISIKNLGEMDMMRGEEVESFGIINQCNLIGPFLMILPGSHTKFIYFDEKNRIEKCSSSIAGELIYAVSNYTILSQCLNSSLVSKIDERYILEGMKFQEKYSLTKAIFGVRLMDTQLCTDENERANFLAGAIISNDFSNNIISEIKNKRINNIYIGGSNPLKCIFKVILENKEIENIKINVLSDKVTETAQAIGAVNIIDMAKKLFIEK